MKSLYTKSLVSAFVGVAFFFGATSAQASTLTQQQVQAVIGLLQSFNADPATINAVGAALGGILSPISSDPMVCPALSYNLYQGLTDTMTGRQVSALQRFLEVTPTGYFGAQTKQAVARFQQQYAIFPVTGGVGPLTRAAILRLCGGVVSPVLTEGVLYLNTPFSIALGASAKESSIGTLSLQVDSVSGAGAQISMGESCLPGTQCFYYPHQSVLMTVNQVVTFQGYTITLTGVGGSYATLYVTKGTGSVMAPTISRITPVQGTTGATVTIYGSGFTNDNTVRFGVGGQQHVPSSNNGTVISYTIPTGVGPCDLVIAGQPICAAVMMQVMPGAYPVSVANSHGQSSPVSFTVTDQANSASVLLMQPIAGQAFTRGQDMNIVWTIDGSLPNTATLAFNLFTESGADLGTIAVAPFTAMSQRPNSNTYVWHIPGFPQNYMCTMQYPNGLCGVSIPTGKYYIKSTASSDAFNTSPGRVVYNSAQSGVFTIYQ